MIAPSSTPATSGSGRARRGRARTNIEGRATEHLERAEPDARQHTRSNGYRTADQVPPELAALYEQLDAFLAALGDDVSKKVLKYYFAYRRLKNFACVEVHPQSRNLLVYLKVNPEDVELIEGFSRDVRQIGHFGTGDLELRISSQEDLDRAQPLLQRSYEAS